MGSGKWSELAGFAESQGGLVTAAQGRMLGFSRPQLAGMAAKGQLERLQHGVYLLSGAPTDRWTQLRAAWLALAPQVPAPDRLAGDPQGVVSHRSAAMLLGLGDLDADRNEFTLPVRRRPRNPDVLIHRGDLAREDWMVWEGLPVTTPTVTVGTLARSGIDGGHLATIVRDTAHRHDVPLKELSEALGPSARRYGYRDGDQFLQALLDQAGVSRSVTDLAVAAAPNLFQSEALASPQMQAALKQFAERLTVAVLTPELMRSISALAVPNSALSPAAQQLVQQRFSEQFAAQILPADLMRTAMEPMVSQMMKSTRAPAVQHDIGAVLKILRPPSTTKSGGQPIPPSPPHRGVAHRRGTSV